MKSKDPKKISDDLVGRDEKVCSCSVRIAELLRSGDRDKADDTPSLAQIIAVLRRRDAADA